MKRFYSIILLLSLLIGIIQPIMPMVDFVFHDGELTELFHPSDQHGCEMSDSQEIYTDCDCCDNNPTDRLLNIDYYPIPLVISANPAQHILDRVTELYSIGDSQLVFIFYQTLLPPPKIV